MAHSLDREIDRLREILWSARDPQGRAFASLADAYRRRGDLPLARTMINEGLDRLPHFSSAHVVAGWIHRDLGSPVEADRAFRRVLELDPENAMALEGLGELAEERGSHAEAAEFFRRLSHVSPASDDDGDADGPRDGPAARSGGDAQRGIDDGAPRVGIDDLSPDLEDPDPAVDLGAGASRTGGIGAVPVQALFPDPGDEAPPKPVTTADDASWSGDVFEGDESAKTVSVGDLAPDDDTFDFGVADLGDEADSGAAQQGEEDAHDAVAGWGLLEEADDAVASPFGPLTDAGADATAGTIERAGPEVDDSGTRSTPDWSWSPAVDEESGVDAPPTNAGPDAGPDAGERPPSRAEERPPGPSPGDAVPIASLAPDEEPAAASLREEDSRSARPVEELAPAAEGDEALAASADATDEDDGADDFQAWLERNSI